MTKDQIRTVFMQRGFTIKEGQSDLKDYVYEAADDLIRLVREEEAARRTVSGQEAEPVCWITREQLTRVEDEGEDAWVYWAETGHVAEPDEVALYAAPIPATEPKDARK
jgi:hypothetical protein